MIELQQITKSFPGRGGRHYVFRDVTMTFPEGKSIGIIGRNGAGKSTLLRILGGLDNPDSGKIHTDKTISWPVGLRGGYHAQLTGRENTEFVCRVYTDSHEAFAEAVEFVKEFSELGDYFDMPTRTYSSGMNARMGFALSMAFDFDYYLIDEVTAVGDRFFKRKSKRALAKKRETASVLMVSHSLGSLEDYCDMGLLIDREGFQLFDTVREAIDVYESS